MAAIRCLLLELPHNDSSLVPEDFHREGLGMKRAGFPRLQVLRPASSAARAGVVPNGLGFLVTPFELTTRAGQIFLPVLLKPRRR